MDPANAVLARQANISSRKKTVTDLPKAYSEYSRSDVVPDVLITAGGFRVELTSP